MEILYRINHLEEFIKHRYKVSDIALREISPAFITDFELFLRTEKNHCTNTVWSYMMPFRSIIYTAINNGWLQRDPFYAYRITKEDTKRGFLAKEEITMYGKSMCEHLMKPASSSGNPFSEQSSSHSSRVLIRKNLHISRSHRKSTHRGDDRPMGNRKIRRIVEN